MYKRLPWDKFLKKKRNIYKNILQYAIFLELQSLDDLVDFFELSMCINASLP